MYCTDLIAGLLVELIKLKNIKTIIQYVLGEQMSQVI